jgi:hypothetical protein
LALPPQLPEPGHRSEKRLTDRAVFLGDLARTGKQSESAPAKENKTRFHQLLEQMGDSDEEAEPQSAAEPAQAQSASPELQAELKDSQIENRKDAERRSQRGGEEEAEKAAGGQWWKGPHPTMGLAMVSAAQQIQAQTIEKQSRAQAQRDATQSDSEDNDSRAVDGALLHSLREAGLAQPLTGFSDPRVRGGTPLLGNEWSVSEFPGARTFRWESGGARQVLRWSEKDCLLETIGGGRRQVIQKLGEQFWSETTPWDSDATVDLGSLPKRPL